jgi:hypothetical protein
MKIDRELIHTGVGLIDNQLIHLTKWLIEWFCEQMLVHDRAFAAFLNKINEERAQ